MDSRINVNNTRTYMDNLQRLGVIEIIRDEYFADESQYEPLKNDSTLIDLKKIIEKKGKKVKFRKGLD